MRFSLLTKISLGFGTSLAILLALSFLSYSSTLRLRENNGWVAHTGEVISTIEMVFSQVKDIQSSQRGYILTGEDRYLDPYRAAAETLGKDLAQLQKLTEDNPRQQASLDRLEGLIAQRLATSQRQIELRRTQGFEVAQQELAKGEGEQMMSQIRKVVTQMEAEEEDLLQQRQEAEGASARRTLVLILLGNLLAVATVALAVLLVRRDLTRRQQAEAERDQFFTLTLDLLCIAGFDGYFKRLNPAWEKVLGYPQEELLAMPVRELVHPDDLQASLEAKQAVVRGNAVVSLESRYRCKDGSYKWLLWNSVAHAGQQLIYATARDITQRKQVEEKRKLEVKLQQVRVELLRLQDKVWRMAEAEDIEGVLSSIGAVLKAKGISFLAYSINLVKEPKGELPIQVYLHDFKGQRFLGALKRDQPEGRVLLESWNTREIRYRPDLARENVYGEHLHPQPGYDPVRSVIDVPFSRGTLALASAHPEAFSAEDRSLFKEITQIIEGGFQRQEDLQLLERRQRALEKESTQRRQAEEVLRQANQTLAEANRKLKESQVQLVQFEKMASLGQLVAGIAHEINNPLAFVANNLFTSEEGLEWIAQQLDGAPAERLARIRRRLEEAGEGVKRVEDLVRKLRTFSRLDEGQFKQVDIHESLDSVLLFLHHKMKERIQVEKHYGPHATLYCTGELNQVLMNLIANAVDAIGGEGKITLATGQRDGIFFISVQDTGQGIPAAVRERIFEPFFTTKPVGQGTGLGLAIAHSIVQAHQGRIRVHSEEGRGTEMVIEIPLDLKTTISASVADN